MTKVVVALMSVCVLCDPFAYVDFFFVVVVVPWSVGWVDVTVLHNRGYVFSSNAADFLEILRAQMVCKDFTPDACLRTWVNRR